jgi:hypothetical protein
MIENAGQEDYPESSPEHAGLGGEKPVAIDTLPTRKLVALSESAAFFIKKPPPPAKSASIEGSHKENLISTNKRPCVISLSSSTDSESSAETVADAHLDKKESILWDDLDPDILAIIQAQQADKSEAPASTCNYLVTIEVRWKREDTIDYSWRQELLGSDSVAYIKELVNDRSHLPAGAIIVALPESPLPLLNSLTADMLHLPVAPTIHVLSADGWSERKKRQQYEMQRRSEEKAFDLNDASPRRSQVAASQFEQADSLWTLQIRGKAGPPRAIKVRPDMTIADVLTEIIQFPTAKLFFDGSSLLPSKSIEACGLEDGDMLELK